MGSLLTFICHTSLGMTGSQTWNFPLRRDWLIAGAAALGYFIAAYFSLYLTRGEDGIATIWPASGVFVAAMMLADSRRKLAVVPLVGLASFSSNALMGITLWDSAIFTLANIVEAVLVSELVGRFGGRSRRLGRLGSVMVFFCAAISAGLVSATLSTLLSTGSSFAFFISWFSTVSLGTMIAAPVIVAIASSLADKRKRVFRDGPLGLALVVALIGGASAAIFALDADHLLFLPVVGVVIAAYLYGASGAAFGIAATAVIAALGTDFTASTDDFYGLDGDTILLQFYLLGLLAAAWPLTALIEDKEWLIGKYAETNRFLELAERTAHLGHWYMAADQSKLVWSAEVYRIHGLTPGEEQTASQTRLSDPDALELYHPGDRDKVRSTLLAALHSGSGFTYQARIIRPDGEERIVSAVGRPRFDAAGQFDGLFGTFHDITEQSQILEALQLARTEALREAETAQRLSETDDLTGIANRRKILSQLRKASRRARHDDHELSVAILDIDKFKSINDGFGHHVGDEVIRRVAQIIAEQSRASDHVGRLGGEEFLIVLPAADAQTAFAVVERLRLAIADEKWSGGPDQVTVSAGLVTITGTDSIEDALQRADEALYEAKHGGRNALRTAA